MNTSRRVGIILAHLGAHPEKIVEIVDEVAQLEEEVDLWRERTSIPKGEWSICIPHNSAYQTDEGCIRCKNDQLVEELIHMRAWARQPLAGLTKKQVMNSIVSMCAHALGDGDYSSVAAKDNPEKTETQ